MIEQCFLSYRETLKNAVRHAAFRHGLAPLLDAEPESQLLAQTEAWGLIEALEPDVVILSINMPEMTGIEVSRKTASTGLSTHVVVLIIHEDPSAACDAQAGGGHRRLFSERQLH